MQLPDSIPYILSLVIFKNTILDWSIALLVIAVSYAILYFLKHVLLRSLQKFLTHIQFLHTDQIFETLRQTKSIVLFLIAIWLGTQGLDLSPKLEKVIRLSAFVAVMIQTGLWITKFLNDWVSSYREERLATNPGAVTSLNVMNIIAKIAIWLCIVLLLLENFGVDITALVAGLGIGGIAVALALQSILGDIFASVVILADKPFMTGDFLILDDYMGTVEYIGMKTTRIRSLSGEQIVLSNSNLLNNRIRNYGRMYERRIPLTIGVTYQTPESKLILIPQIIREAVEAQDNTRFDRAHFMRYGSSSLDFEYVYYVLSPDYNLYMDINQLINLAIYRRFAEEDIRFAYPTQSVFVEAMPSSHSDMNPREKIK